MSSIERIYVWIPEPVEGFDDRELSNELESWLDENEGGYTFVDEDGETVAPCVIVREPRAGEARGLYEQRENGNLQILGYSVAVPERLRELTDAAFNAVCCG